MSEGLVLSCYSWRVHWCCISGRQRWYEYFFGATRKRDGLGEWESLWRGGEVITREFELVFIWVLVKIRLNKKLVGKMDRWIVEHWIESNDAISPEEDRHEKVHSPWLTLAFFFFFFKRPVLFNKFSSDIRRDWAPAIVENIPAFNLRRFRTRRAAWGFSQVSLMMKKKLQREKETRRIYESPAHATNESW